MRTILINAPWVKGDLYGVRAGSRWPHLEDCGTSSYMPFPFFMSYAAAVLARAGKAVAVIDACAERLDDNACLSRIEEFRPDLVVVETSTPSIEVDLSFAAQVKDRLPGVFTAFCGPHAPMMEHGFLERHKNVDFLFRGEYEMILHDLVNVLEDGGDPGSIKGITHRRPDGLVVDNGPRPLLKDIDSLPWPARDLFPMELYDDRPGGIPCPSLQMWASRGCPYQCVFCVWPQVMYGGNTYRVRNPADVADEIQYCLERWPFKSFYFDDDTFNIGKSRIIALCEGIRSRNISVPWGAMARADHADREVLTAMKAAGLVSIKYGMESGVQELIDASGKNLKIEQVEDAVRISKELGLEVHLTFTLGLPGETKETIRRTIRKAVELDPFSVQFSIATPFPGTVYYETLKEDGRILSENWEDYSGSTGAVHRTEELTDKDLNRALEWAYSAWDRHRLMSIRHWPRLSGQVMAHPLGSISRLVTLVKHLREHG